MTTRGAGIGPPKSSGVSGSVPIGSARWRGPTSVRVTTWPGSRIASQVRSGWNVSSAKPPGRRTRCSSSSHASSKSPTWVNTEPA